MRAEITHGVLTITGDMATYGSGLDLDESCSEIANLLDRNSSEFHRVHLQNMSQDEASIALQILGGSEDARVKQLSELSYDFQHDAAKAEVAGFVTAYRESLNVYEKRSEVAGHNYGAYTPGIHTFATSPIAINTHGGTLFALNKSALAAVSQGTAQDLNGPLITVFDQVSGPSQAKITLR